MTSKADLITAVAKRLGESQTDVKQFLAATLEAIESSLLKGQSVQLSGFGAFSVKSLPARDGHNPRTGEKIAIPARRKITFKPSSDLKGRL